MTTHAVSVCPRPGCKSPKPRDHYACKRHWYELHWRLRQRIFSAFNGGKGALSPEWTKAHEDALAYWKKRDHANCINTPLFKPRESALTQ